MTISFTSQTRLHITDQDLVFFRSYASYFAMVEHKLFKDIVKGDFLRKDLKREYLKKYNITARQFNSIWNDLDGKLESRKKCLQSQIKQLKESIKSKKKWLKKKEKQLKKEVDLKKRKDISFKIHNKKRKLQNQEDKLIRLLTDLQNKVQRFCFGGKKLFKKQFNLAENGYESIEDWKIDWQKARSKNIYLLGSSDETGGNQSCTLFNNELRIRVPNQLVKQYGKYYTISVTYSYGQKEINDALSNKNAITHRIILKDEKVYLHSTVKLLEVKKTTHHCKQLGIIGVDLNKDNVAICEVDRYGNYLNSRTLPTLVEEKSNEKTKAIYGDVVKEIVEKAKKLGKPIACEELDFQKKRSQLKEESKKYARMMSSFAYNTFYTILIRKAYREGVAVIPENPAYTSIIGKTKFMGRYGITPHESAAMAIARRAQRYKEKVPAHNACEPLVKMAHQHVWKSWSFICKDKVIKKRGHHIFYNWRSLQDTTGFILQKFKTYGEILVPEACGARV